MRRFSLALAAAVALALCVSGTPALAQTFDENFPVSGNQVLAMAKSGNTLYVGGNFWHVGPASGTGAIVDAATAAPAAGFPEVIGTIYCVEPDGAGGWYIGGNFSSVGGEARQGLAHVLSNNTVAAWDPGANDIVHAMRLDGGIIYIGGRFTTVAGQTRNYAAALDATTAVPTAWDPNGNQRIYDLEISGSTVYVGGLFTSMGGQVRNWLAALDKTTGLATAWDPSPNGTINDIEIDGSTIYVGGDSFNMIGGLPRTRVAALDATTGIPSAWTPNPDGGVTKIAVDGSIVYIGGWFFNCGGQARRYAAAVDKTTGLANAFNPHPSGQIEEIIVSGASVYLAGFYSTVSNGAVVRTGVAKVDAADGTVQAWDAGTDSWPNAMALVGSELFIGGGFTSVGAVNRRLLAAIDVTTGQVLPWNPDGGVGIVYALDVQGNTVYAGGTFTTVGGQARAGLAAIDATTGAVTSWNPSPNALPLDLEVSGSNVYVAGGFTTIGGQPRNRVAAIDVTTGLATAWNPNSNNEINDIDVIGNSVYVGGRFSFIGGQSRGRVAELDLTTGLATAWNPNVGGITVETIAVGENDVYMGGFFTDIGGQPRNHLGAADRTSGAVTTWDPNPDSQIRVIDVLGPAVYVGGSFSTIGGLAHNRVAAFNGISGIPTDWDPQLNADVWSMLPDGNTLYLGGQWTAMAGRARARLAAVTADPTPTGVAPDAGGNVGPLTVSVAGSGFQDGSQMLLARAAPPDTIIATLVDARADGRAISGTFDLAGAAMDNWDVVVRTPDLQDGVLPGAMAIGPPEPHELRADIVGPSLMRPNRRTAFDIVVENLSNNDVETPVLWVSGIPADATVELGFSISHPTLAPGEPDWSTAPLTFNGPSGDYMAIVIPRLPPGHTVRRIFLSVPNLGTNFTLNATLMPPWKDELLLRDCLSGAGLTSNPACLGFVVDAANDSLKNTVGLEGLSGIALWSKVAWICEGVATLPAAITDAEQVLDFMLGAIDDVLPSGCQLALAPRWQDKHLVGVVSSVDPNDKFGPTGVGPDHRIGMDQLIAYSVRFENLEAATAPAQEVQVFDVLDGTKLDLSEVSLGVITFGDRQVFPPPGVTSYTTDIDLRPGKDLIVRFAVNLDPATGVLAWHFTSLDPVTGQLPDDPLAGFLPPNVTPPEGEGSVLFTLRPKPGLAGGTQILNDATILFDGAPLVTPDWLNTLDADSPESAVLPLGAVQDSATFTVSWAASGPPADLRDFSVYVSENGGPYWPWRLHVRGTADTIAAPAGRNYEFYSLARDSSGNLEAVPPVPDQSTMSRVSVTGARSLALGLQGAVPNPATGDVRVWFTLPSRERAVLDVMDVAGRRVLRREVSTLGPGRHSLDLSESIGGPGLYFLKLRQGDRVVSSRMVVLK